MAYGFCFKFPTMITFGVILLMFWLSMPGSCEGRPQWTLPNMQFTKKFKSFTQCDQDMDLLELCQRCAKATKSNYAYPMCCTNQENATGWCKDYIYFGIQN